jgi:hypothetical protein
MDDELKILQASEWPAGLADLDDRILDAVAERQRESAATRKMMIFSAFISLGCGVVAGGAMPVAAVAAAPISPLVPNSPLTQVVMAEAR